MTRYFPLAALLAAGLGLAAAPPADAVAPPAPPESDLQRVVYLGDRGPVLIGLHVRINGRPFRAAHRDLMNKLFDSLDRDRDGVLSKAEAANAPPASALANAFGLFTGGRQQARVDADGDGRVTREELAAHYRRTGLAPFQVTYAPRSTGVIRLDRMGGEASAEQLTARLFALLDADKDGKLSRKELRAAPDLLKKLDIDQDEMLTADELRGEAAAPGDGTTFLPLTREVAMTTPAAGPLLHVLDDGQAGEQALAKVLTLKYSRRVVEQFSPRRPAVTLTVRLGKRGPNEPLVEVKGGKLPEGLALEKAADGVTLVLGQSRLELGGPASDGKLAFANFNVTAQYKTQFQMADADSNGYLDKQEASKSPFFRDAFAAMDADGDGMLYEKEMMAYVKQMESLRDLAGKSCLSVVVSNKGQGLMERLDADKDGRLSARELRNAPKVLDPLDADKDGLLARAEVPAHHRGSFELGPVGGNSNFARAVVVFANGQGPQAVPERTGGPLWFRKMDRNRDGDVSRAEFLGTDKQFQAIDADGDGLISAAEAERFDRRSRTSKD